MSLDRLQWVILGTAILLGALFEVSFFFLIHAAPEFSLVFPLSTAVLIGGIVAFTQVVFRVLGQVQAGLLEKNRQLEIATADIAQRVEHLRAINEAGLALNSELALKAVLQKVVDLSRSLVNARYGALAVVNRDGMIEEFITSGLSAEEGARIGSPPRGHGLLGMLLREGKPLLVPVISEHPDAVGFPPNHPLMQSFLGVPVVSKAGTIGNLYLTDKQGSAEFSKDDLDTVVIFANHAAIAIENARLYRQLEQLTLLQERDRIGKELHDGVIQSIYAVGLGLEEGIDLIEESPGEAKERLNWAVDRLNETIKDIRSYILDLRPQLFEGRDLKEGLEELVREFRLNSLIEPQFEVEGTYEDLAVEDAVNLFQIAREALTNIRKHAGASQALLRLSRSDSVLTLYVEDNGVGFEPGSMKNGGYGLLNIASRVEQLNGKLQIEGGKGHGTRLTVQVPMPAGRNRA